MGVGDLHRAVAFWTEALDYVPKREITPEDDFMILVPKAGEGAHLALDVSESPIQQYPASTSTSTPAMRPTRPARSKRLVALGATRVDWDRYPENADFVVLADTEGNPFCVIDTSG